MAFQAVPNGAMCTVHGRLDGENVANTLGFGLVTPGVITSNQLDVLVAGVATMWEGVMLATLPTLYTFEGVTGRVLDVENGPVSENSIGSGAQGQLVGAILPHNCSFTVSFRTGLGGATNRGRNYVAGLLESEVTGSTLGITRINALRAAYQDFIGPNNVAIGWVWSVISRKIIIPTVTGRAVPIGTVHITDGIIDSQRRRLPGRGN